MSNGFPAGTVVKSGDVELCINLKSSKEGKEAGLVDKIFSLLDKFQDEELLGCIEKHEDEIVIKQISFFSWLIDKVLDDKKQIPFNERIDHIVDDDYFLTTKEAARYLHLSTSLLRRWRLENSRWGPSYTFQDGYVGYKAGDLKNFKKKMRPSEIMGRKKKYISRKIKED